MLWFAFYYIPPQDSAFYRLGSALLGYDVRGGALLTQDTAPEVDPHWTRDARAFGFHLTITEALTFDRSDLNEIETEIADILGSFCPESEMSLVQTGLETWKAGTVWVLRYRPSRALELLQAVTVARLARYGKGSMFFDEIAANPGRYSAPYERRRLKTFLSPRGLDTWQPHFTLLNPHPGDEHPDLRDKLAARFAPFGRLEPATFSLVLKEDDGPWRLHRDYAWPPEPR